MTAIRRFFSVIITGILLSTAVFAGQYGVEVNDYSIKIGEQTLPFEDYPVGSYFTDNGKACNPHPQSWCSNCKNTYGELKLSAMQCKGFARMVFYRLFGTMGRDDEDKDKYVDIVRDISGKKITVEYMRELFTSGNIKPGAHIRINNVHSLVFAGCDEEHIYTYEANANIPGDKNSYTCRVTMRKRTFEEAAQYFKRRGISYVRMPLEEDYPVTMPERSEEDLPEISEIVWVYLVVTYDENTNLI